MAGSDSLLFLYDPVPTIISSLKEDVPIEKLIVRPRAPDAIGFLLQDFLVEAMSASEWAMYTNSTTVPVVKAPITKYMRDDLAEALSKEPELLEKYDLYTWKNPELWQSFVELSWDVKRARSPKLKDALNLASRLEKFIGQKEFDGCDKYELHAELNALVSMASSYDTMRAMTPLIPISRTSRNYSKRAKSIKADFAAYTIHLSSSLRRLGHEYRHNYLAGLAIS